MAGFQSLLARLAIGELLNLLSQDDWFLVLRVRTSATLSLSQCLPIMCVSLDLGRLTATALTHLDASTKLSEHLQRTLLYVRPCTSNASSPVVHVQLYIHNLHYI